MAIDRWGLVLIMQAAERGVDFSTTCMIGRQHLNVTERQLTRLGLPAALASRRYADDLFRHLGAEAVESLDYSDFEGATIVHDLNAPVRPSGSFSAVVEGGTLEHVFHVPNAIESIVSLVAPGGHLLAISPTDGYAGHGFYQFSPEFWFRVLDGFDVELARIHEITRGWFDVTDPAQVGHRVELSSVGAYLYLIARRRGEETVGTPTQSDYEATWKAGAVRPPRRLLTMLPAPVHAVLKRLRPRRPGLTRTRESAPTIRSQPGRATQPAQTSSPPRVDGDHR